MDYRILFFSFAAVFLAELGDKTQLTALGFSASSKSPWSVFIGTSLALVTTTALAVIFGSLLAKHVPEKVMHIASGVMFVLLGLVLLVNVARKAPAAAGLEKTPAEAMAPAAAAAVPLNKGGISGFVLRQAAAFEDEIAASLEVVAAELPEGAERRALQEIISQDRQHSLRLQAFDSTEVTPADAETANGPLPPSTVSLPGRGPQPAEAPARLDAAGRAETIRRAMEIEEAAGMFYLSLAQMCKIGSVRDAFRALAAEELQHAKSLAALCSQTPEQV